MQVDGPERWDGQDRRRQEAAIVERKNNIRPQPPNLFHEGRRVRVIGSMHGDPVSRRQLCHRPEPDRLTRIVAVGHHRHDVRPTAQKLLQARHPDVAVTEHYDPHGPTLGRRANPACAHG
jgi:hypothetical protein